MYIFLFATNAALSTCLRSVIIVLVVLCNIHKIDDTHVHSLYNRMCMNFMRKVCKYVSTVQAKENAWAI